MAEHEEAQHGGEEAGHEEAHGKKGHGGGGHGPGHGGGHEEHAGAPEWLISFADNVALLMGFFVILLAMNMKEKTAGGIGGKDKYGEATESAAMQDFVIAMRAALHNEVDINGTDPKEAALRQRLRERSQIKESSQTGPRGKKPEQQAIKPSELNRINATFGFDANATTMTPSSIELAGEVAKRLRGQRFIIEVRGHVSSLEAVGGIGPAMELSYKRAMSAALSLVEKGMAWNQLRLVACGDSDRRTAAAYDQTGHATNQRVEIVVTDEPIPADAFLKEPGKGGEK